jgi:hypothetical protein
MATTGFAVTCLHNHPSEPCSCFDASHTAIVSTTAGASGPDCPMFESIRYTNYPIKIKAVAGREHTGLTISAK